MGNYFSALSTEALKNELEVTKQRARTGSQQDKVMLFALESELEKRMKDMRTSESSKLSALYEKLLELQSELNGIELNKISGETILSKGVFTYELLSNMAATMNNAINAAKKS